MLYFASFYCPLHTVAPQLFDKNKKRPCIGRCGHTICLKCVENNIDCTLCERPKAFEMRTPNYKLMDLMKECRDDLTKVFQNWRSGEKFGYGTCSKCFAHSGTLRICLTCNPELYCWKKNGEVQLQVVLLIDFLKLAQHVLCADCALENHIDCGHGTMKMHDARFDKSLRRLTLQVICEFLRDEIRNQNLPVTCKLRFLRIEQAFFILSMKIDNLEHLEESECGYLGEQTEKELVKRFIENVESEMKIVSEKPICECIRIYEKLAKTKTKMNYDQVYKMLSMSQIEAFPKGCPLFYSINLRHRNELCSVIKQKPPKLPKPTATQDSSCPLCILLDFNETTPEQNSKLYLENCMEIYEKFWKNELPRLQTLCFRCLFHLNQQSVGNSCLKFERRENQNRCHFKECLLKNPSYWKYAVICNLRVEARKITLKGIEESIGFIDCKLRRSKMKNTLITLDQWIGTINLRLDNADEFVRKVSKVDDLLECLIVQWSVFRFGTKEEKEMLNPGFECRCIEENETVDFSIDKLIFDHLA